MPVSGRITLDPEICNGKPTLSGKRITVQTILDYLGAGDTAEDIQACLSFAAAPH